MLLDEFNDPKFRPCPLLRRYVQAGWLSRTGRGFHRYDGTAAQAAMGRAVTE